MELAETCETDPKQTQECIVRNRTGGELTKDEKCAINLRKLIRYEAELANSLSIEDIMREVRKKNSLTQFVRIKSDKLRISKTDFVWSRMKECLPNEVWEFHDTPVDKGNRIRSAARKPPLLNLREDMTMEELNSYYYEDA